MIISLSDDLVLHTFRLRHPTNTYTSRSILSAQQQSFRPMLDDLLTLLRYVVIPLFTLVFCTVHNNLFPFIWIDSILY